MASVSNLNSQLQLYQWFNVYMETGLPYRYVYTASLYVCHMKVGMMRNVWSTGKSSGSHGDGKDI